MGAGLAAVAVFRRRPGAALLVGICVRLLLDPQTYPYYTAGLLAGAAAYDLAVTRSPVPVASIAAVLAVYLPQYLLLGRRVAGYPGYLFTADLRAGFCLAAIGLALVLARDPGPDATGRSRTGCKSPPPGQIAPRPPKQAR